MWFVLIISGLFVCLYMLSVLFTTVEALLSTRSPPGASCYLDVGRVLDPSVDRQDICKIFLT